MTAAETFRTLHCLPAIRRDEENYLSENDVLITRLKCQRLSRNWSAGVKLMLNARPENRKGLRSRERRLLPTMRAAMRI